MLSPTTSEKKLSSSAKKLSRDSLSPVKPLNQSQTSSQSKNKKLKSARVSSYQMHTPVKVKFSMFLIFIVQEDDIEFRLSEYIRNHKDSKRLSRLFQRKSVGNYHFANNQVSIKLEKGELYGNVCFNIKINK